MRRCGVWEKVTEHQDLWPLDPREEAPVTRLAEVLRSTAPAKHQAGGDRKLIHRHQNGLKTRVAWVRPSRLLVLLGSGRKVTSRNPTEDLTLPA